MKRFHVHLHVDDLARNVEFYSKLFDARPTHLERDYAKWMLDDPRVNFAVSTNSGPGIDHLGFQAENEEELAQLKGRAREADQTVFDEGVTVCCYSNSEKHWITDPQGIAWEHYRTMGASMIFGQRRDKVSQQVQGLARRAAKWFGRSKHVCCGSR